jgi:hypothetical protein
VKTPTAHYCDEYGVIVHSTHDVELAKKLAYAYELEQRGLKPGDTPEYPIDLPNPVPTWLRTRPARPDEQAAYCISFWYSEGQPGVRGSFPAVEFPENGGPLGLPVTTGGRS